MNPVNTQIKLNGWWGKQSALLEPNSFLSVFKCNILKELKTNGLIGMKEEQEPRNMTSHIQITDSAHPKDNIAYSRLHMKNIKLSAANIQIEKNFVKVILDNTSNLHMTLCYKKNLGRERGRVMESIKRAWIAAQNVVFSTSSSQPPSIVTPEIKSSSNSTSSTATTTTEIPVCIVCMNESYTHTFIPCGHMCTCELCANKLQECPMCRAHILNRIKVFAA